MNENKKDNKKGNKNGKYDKNEFKRDVIERIREMFICGIETATQEQIYRAVCFVAMELISENWLGTKNAVRQYNTKTVYYLSMEFLVGRTLGCNLLNLGAWSEVREALEELGVDLNLLEDQEPDPALGNGGMGRLARLRHSLSLRSVQTGNRKRISERAPG